MWGADNGESCVCEVRDYVGTLCTFWAIFLWTYNFSKNQSVLEKNVGGWSFRHETFGDNYCASCELSFLHRSCTTSAFHLQLTGADGSPQCMDRDHTHEAQVTSDTSTESSANHSGKEEGDRIAPSSQEPQPLPNISSKHHFSFLYYFSAHSSSKYQKGKGWL